MLFADDCGLSLKLGCSGSLGHLYFEKSDSVFFKFIQCQLIPPLFVRLRKEEPQIDFHYMAAKTGKAIKQVPQVSVNGPLPAHW